MEKRLTAIAVKNAGDGKLHDGGGLMLVKKSGSGKWVYRYSRLGKRREMGLGAWPALSLAEARDARKEWAAILARGDDPIDERERRRADEIASRDREDPTFADMVDIVFEARRATLRDGGARGRWRSPLDHHVIPVIGKRRMSDLHRTDIHQALAPIWRTKHPTAIKAYTRTKIVFAEAQAMGFECDPGTVDAAKRMLGEVRHQVEHIAATPWQEIPALWGKLDPSTASGLCLRWILMTLVRGDAARAARLSEIEGDIWTVPAHRIKGREGLVQDFRVPLSEPAMQIAEEARSAGHDLLFPGSRGTPITATAIEKYLTKVGETGRPHGFRTSFRTWAQDHDISYDVGETILGHSVGGRVERTYARSDLLDRRRVVMDAWAEFVTGGQAEVIALRR